MTNEEKILEMLASLSQEVKEQRGLLTAQGQKQEEQGGLLASLTQKQEEQGGLLASLSQKQEEQGSLLASLSQEVKEHGSLLTALSQKQEEQGSLLASLSQKQEEQGARLNAMEKDLAETKQAAERAAVLLETEVRDNMKLLFDGQKLLTDTMVPSSRVAKLENDVSTLNGAVKLLSKDVAKLKKAQ